MPLHPELSARLVAARAFYRPHSLVYPMPLILSPIRLSRLLQGH